MKKRAKDICLLLLDVDGVLTDGRIIFDGAGEEWKFFNVKDGHGIKMLQRAGLAVGILSGRSSRAVRVRARDLGIALVIQKAFDKGQALEKIITQKHIEPRQICYVGDDVVDIPVFSRVGLAVAVADSVAEAKAGAHYITRCPGGRGAVREVCDLLLKCQGKWPEVTQKYFQSLPE
ncbi:MAG: HAD-IIIA family hydrolase [Deltaproteobacteria bacterium]|nr:HAD-IIIA family hydrolase [Deltaproteobacteria bacterium]